MGLLPTEKSKPNVQVESLKLLVHGEPKVGKTSLFMRFGKPLFLRTSQSDEVFSLHKVDIKDWETFKRVVEEIVSGKHEFTTIVIDVIDDIYSYCVNYCNKKLSIDHVSDAKFGKGYHYIDNEFEFWMGKLLMSKYGLGLLSHLNEKDVITKDGKTTKIVPSLNNRGRLIIEKKVAIITHLKWDKVKKQNTKLLEYEEKLVLITKQSAELMVGDWTGMMPDKMILHTIPSGVPRTQDVLEEYAQKNYELIQTYLKGEMKEETK